MLRQILTILLTNCFLLTNIVYALPASLTEPEAIALQAKAVSPNLPTKDQAKQPSAMWRWGKVVALVSISAGVLYGIYHYGFRTASLPDPIRQKHELEDTVKLPPLPAHPTEKKL